MKFTELLLDVDNYNAKILSMLREENTVIFFDTNILTYLFKINKKSRKEFYSWVSNVKTRIKVPEYVVHEYNKRCISNDLGSFNQLNLNAKGIAKEIETQREFMCLCVDDETVKRVQGYSDAENFMGEYEKALKVIRDLSTISDAKGNHLYLIASEIKDNFEDKIIDSNFADLLSSCNEEFVSRSHCSVPPGFEDKTRKKENTYGDFIIWKEIINFSIKHQVKKAILITRDNKKDYVYAPLKIKVNDIIKTNGKGEYVIIHPFLLSEFQQKTKGADFEIINFYSLIEFLSVDNPENFKNLARAVQIEVPDKDESESQTDMPGITEEATVEAPQEEQISVLGIQDECEIEVAKEIKVGESAYKDSNYIVESGVPIDDIIGGLKTHAWNKQNVAILNLPNLSGKTLDDYSSDKWFVLGRNIYQAASGNAFKAMNFINALQYKLVQFGEGASNCILYGMAYEIYFNSNGEFRGVGKFKSNYVNEVYERCSDVRYCNSRKSINSHFKDYEETLLFREWPSPKISFDFDQSLNPSGGVVIHNIRFRGKNILEDVSLFEYSYFTVEVEYSFEKVKEIICSYFGLPISIVEFKNVDEGLVVAFARNMIFHEEFVND